MNALSLIFWVISGLVVLAVIILVIKFLKRRRQNATYPVTINYVRRDISAQGQFLYLELEIKNNSSNSVFISEVQQRNIIGPFETFLLQDANGKTKRSFYEIREAFPKKAEIKNGFCLFRYFRMKLLPPMMDSKLYLQYRVVTKAGDAIESMGIWVVPSELEQMPFNSRN